MTEDEVLNIAKKDYPIGTKYKCVNGNIDCHNVFIERRSTEDGIFTVVEYEYHKDLEGISSNNGWIFLYNKWAEIVNESDVNYNYLITMLNKLNIK